MTVDLDQTPLRYGASYDELSADGVTPRPHWTHLMESLRAIGTVELGRRWSRAERRIRENGITYNIYGDPLGADRPWKIDVVPFLIAANEWRFIEAGIIQRAQLLSLVLEDLYGPQELIADGHFPAALLYANPAFLRPLVGVRVPVAQLSAYAGGRSCTFSGRPVVGARRSHPGPVGQRLCVGKSDNRRRCFARSVSAPRMCCAWLLFSAHSATH
jgi:uncharacterized circularly permuted ATP-grasp superfamily protein